MSEVTWQARRNSDSVLVDVTADVDGMAQGAPAPNPLEGGSNTELATGLNILNSTPARESLHVEATVAPVTNLASFTTPDGVVVEIGRQGAVLIAPNGNPDGTPALTVDPSSLNSDPTGDVLKVTNNWGDAVHGVTKSGFTYIQVGNPGSPTENAPADAELVAGQLILWFDDTDGAGKLMVKAKTADGTVRTGSINLT